MNLKIKEALLLHKAKGGQLSAFNLGQILWPSANEDTQRVSISGLMNGKRPTIQLEWIKKLSTALGVDPNFLTGYNPKTKSFDK